MMLRIGMIGAGIISKNHAEVIQMLEEVELVAVADIVMKKAIALEKKYGAKILF